MHLTHWSTVCEPVLAFSRLGEDFVVDVDASDVAFGGVLIQEGSDSLLHPVGYFSDAVQKSQKSWSPTTKEAFALSVGCQTLAGLSCWETFYSQF